MTKKGGGMKSAYELAMERLEQQQGKLEELTDEQRDALARVDSETKAKKAEIEILYEQKIAEARLGGDVAQVEQLGQERLTDVNRLERRAEDERERIRKGANK